MTRLQQRAQLAMSQVKIMHNVGANPEIEGYKKYKEQEQKFKAHLKKQTIASKNSIKKGRGGEQMVGLGLGEEGMGLLLHCVCLG